MRTHRVDRKPRRPRDPAPRGRPPDRSPVEPSETVYGLRAGLAVFERRPGDILRVAHARTVRGEVAGLSRWAEAQGVPCSEVTDDALARIADSALHEGLCVATRPRKWLSTGEFAATLDGPQGFALALDRVRNPYNVGAILRTAAFFGLKGTIFGAPAPHPGVAPMAVRVAEGAAEWLHLARTTDLADTLGKMRSRRIRVVGADVRADRTADFAFAAPVVLVVGNEREGLGDRVRQQCDAVVAIRGAGAIESLNVAVAAGVLISRLARWPA